MAGVLQAQSLSGGSEEVRKSETYKVYKHDRISPAVRTLPGPTRVATWNSYTRTGTVAS